MTIVYDYIFLSPHLDDAILSCGGFISQETAAGKTALVATFFSGTPEQGTISSLAKKAHAMWGLGTDAMRFRREEDARACFLVGADYIHLGELDCIYRCDENSGVPLYSTQEDIFGPINGGDKDILLPRLSKLIGTLKPAHRLFAPLGIGSHVDHHLVKMAIQETCSEHVSFYEDFPYCIDAKIIPPPTTQSFINRVSSEALNLKIRAIHAYESQIAPIFSTRENVRSWILGCAETRGGERVWRTVGTGDG